MKKLLVLALIVAGGYMAWKRLAGGEPKLKPLYPTPYVVVYGQDSEPWTRNYLQRLRAANVNCVYKEFGLPATTDELVPRLQEAQVDMSSMLYPIVDVNGRMMIRPRMEKIFAVYDGRDDASSGSRNEVVSAQEGVVVYGRDSCGWTQKALAGLQEAGIRYAYKTVDSFEVEEELYWRMKDAGLDARALSIPVIAAKGKVHVAPKMSELIPILRSN